MAKFNASLHPRKSNGQFARKGAGAKSSRSSRTTGKGRGRSSLHNNTANKTKSAKSGSNAGLITGAVVAGALVAGGAYAYSRRNDIAKSLANNPAARAHLENNVAVRTAVIGDLRTEATAKLANKRPIVGLKLAKPYRMGRASHSTRRTKRLVAAGLR